MHVTPHQRRLARRAVSARRDLGRRGRELRALLRARREGRALPVRRPTAGASVQRIALRERTDYVWHGYLPERGPGSLRLPRARPLRARAGHRFNPHKLLLDPYAKRLRRRAALERRALRLHARHRSARTCRSTGATARRACRSAACSSPPSPGATTAARRPVARHGDLRGARARLHHAASRTCRAAARHLRRPGVARRSIEHLQRLGVTAVELLPVHAFVDDRHLVEQGLRNYWGYNTLGFFAPSCATAPPAKVKRVQDDGEDAARGGHRGDPRRGLQPHLRRQPPRARRCRFRGIDNAAYYRLVPERPRYYVDFTGCGNTLNLRASARAAADDGLAALLGRARCTSTASASTSPRRWRASCTTVDHLGGFFDAIRQDPVLCRVKLIAEPWDLGDGGYQVGNFPLGWAEWNGRYRDALRALLEGRRRHDRRVRAPAHRLAATSTAASRPAAARQHQLRHRARRLHAARPGLLQRQAQRGQRRGQPRRQRQQPLVELRRRRADRRRRRSSRCASARSATSWPRCCCRRACRCCWPATRSAARSAATTTPTARTTRSSWLDWTLTPERDALLDFVQPADPRCGARTRSFRRRSFFRGEPRRRRPKDVVWLQPDGRR